MSLTVLRLDAVPATAARVFYRTGCPIAHSLRERVAEPGETAKWLSILSVLAKDSGFVPSNHMTVPNSCTSSFGGFGEFF